MYDLAKAYRNIQNSLPNRRVEDWEASVVGVTLVTQAYYYDFRFS